MDPVSELLNLSQIVASTNAKKDRKQNNSYRNIDTLNETKRPSLIIGESNWTKEDRRTGSDRRTAEKDRHKKFEYRFKQDRRKEKTIFVKA